MEVASPAANCALPAVAATAESRGKGISTRLLSRWANLFLGSALLLSVALPHLLSPPAAITNDARWGTMWFPSIYGVVWGGATLHALLALIASMILTNVVGSAQDGDVEAVVRALATHELAAQQCGHRRREQHPATTRMAEVSLAVIVLGTSWRPPILLAPGVFFRPCLAFFFLATTWTVFFTLPVAFFVVHCIVMIVGAGLSLGAVRTMHELARELATDRPNTRVSSNGLIALP